MLILKIIYYVQAYYMSLDVSGKVELAYCPLLYAVLTVASVWPSGSRMLLVQSERPCFMFLGVYVFC